MQTLSMKQKSLANICVETTRNFKLTKTKVSYTGYQFASVHISLISLQKELSSGNKAFKLISHS